MADDLLATALAVPIQVPVEHDWSFRADDPAGGYNRYGWGAADQALFEGCWTEDVTDLAHGLIAAYGAMWPWPMPRTAVARLPGFAAQIMKLAEQRRIGQRHTYRDRPDSVYELATMYGSFDHMRALRPWPPAQQLVCPICGRQFLAGILSPWMLRQYGSPRFCNYCCVRARNGRSYETRDATIDGLRQLADAIEGIPEQSIASTVALGGMSDERRDRIMAGLIVAPSPAQARATVGPTWLAVLQAAGLVGDAWRPGRGTYCLAADGHLCRSLAERTIDDFLTARAIPHACEPTYPGSNSRADWSLPDGTFVEYAGLLSDADYRAKIEAKRTQAAQHGIPLIVLVPEDLTDLERTLHLAEKTERT